MGQRPTHELDEIDLTIIKELARDGRMPVSRFAKKAGINQHAASDRLQRIINEGIIKIVVLPALPILKQNLLVSIGFIVTPGHSIHAVAEKLTSFPNFRLVALVTGPYDIVSWALFRNLEELSVFFRHEIGKISGITRSETLIHLETVKNVLSYPISEASPHKYELSIQKKKVKKIYSPDKLDMSIIKELQKDARMPIIKLAKKLGVSRVSAAKRLQQLLSEGIIEVIAVSEPGSLGYDMTAMIGIQVLSGKVEQVAHELASFNSVHFVAITLGRFDLLLGVHFSQIQSFSDFIKDGLGTIPDIAKTEHMIYLDVIRRPWDDIPKDNNI